MNSLFFLIAVYSFVGVPIVQAVLDQSQFNQKVKDMKDTLHSTCISKSGTDEGSIAKVTKGEFTDEAKIKAYMACLLSEGGVIDDKGNWNLDVTAELVPENFKDTIIANVKNCVGKTSSIEAVNDRVFAFLKCDYELNPDLFIFF